MRQASDISLNKTKENQANAAAEKDKNTAISLKNVGKIARLKVKLRDLFKEVY